MNYERLLEIHLVSSRMTAGTTNILQDGTDRYQYDFFREVNGQRRAYRDNLQQAFNNAISPVERMLNPHARPQVANSLHVDHVLESRGAPFPMQNLEPQHYVSCYVDLESLRPGEPLIPKLAALVEWVCATQNRAGSPTKGKLRLNSHGSCEENAGLSMGESRGRNALSPDELVDALIRHGLGTRAMQYSSGRQNLVAEAATWKPDNAVTACENETCKKPFKFFERRRHHCRMCGGIFCDACTKKRRTLRNPLTEQGHASGTVDDCRVCDVCASKAETISIGNAKARTGLVQITLALCLTARTAREFATAKAGFARNSIAARLVKRLAMQGIHGIQVSGSNEVIRGTTKQDFDLMYPGMSAAKTKTKGPAYDPFDGMWAGVGIQEESLEIPCSILGTRGEANPVIPSIIGDAAYNLIRDQQIVPIVGGNKLAFGIFRANTPEERLVRQALSRWKFISWRTIEEPVGRIAELTRFGGNLADQEVKEAQTTFFTASAFGSTANRTARATAAAVTNSAPRSGPQSTIVIDAPQRRVTIRRNPKDPNSLIVSGFEERRYKDFKVYEVS